MTQVTAREVNALEVSLGEFGLAGLARSEQFKDGLGSERRRHNDGEEFMDLSDLVSFYDFGNTNQNRGGIRSIDREPTRK
jgi:hypothetical protein